MKRFVLLPLLVALLGCEPAVRFSSVPQKPTPDGHGRTHGGSIDSRYESSTIDTRRFSEIIEGYLGTSYRSGGYGKLGIDCSGLVYAVYRDYGNLHLPPDTKKLFNGLPKVGSSSLRCGDLVFFSPGGKHASHVGIYIGDDKFVHASQSRGVIVSSLSEDYYRQSFVGARRVVD